MNKHLNDRQLLAYLENDLPPARRERAEVHLSACPACRARLEALTQTAGHLTATLHTVEEQVPSDSARSWEMVARRWKKQRPRPPILPFRPRLRYLATLAVLALFVVGLAGLIHTLATTGPDVAEATPTPKPTPTARPSSAPGPLPRPQPDHLTAPISLLILGADGESETSGETDTLMLLYLDAEAERAFLLSIPRDLYVEMPGHRQTRAGSVYGIGEKDETTSGLVLARETISATLGLPIQYTALVHFDGFVALIDDIGGLDVEVPHPIEDPTFPDDHGGRDPLFIPAGRRHFDGETALRYARTRAVPAPGFDRAFRQQQLVLAVHERVIRLDMLPTLIAQAPTLWSAIASGLETDLSLSNAIDLALLATNLAADDITTATLDECCTVKHVTPAGERVLLPQPEEIKTLMENLLEETQ